MPRGTTQVVTRGASNDWCQMCRYEVRGGRASVRGTVAVRGVSTRQYEVIEQLMARSDMDLKMAKTGYHSHFPHLKKSCPEINYSRH
ncbi:hypothetical protein Tco_0805492 [Tanacetum coccineum]